MKARRSAQARGWQLTLLTAVAFAATAGTLYLPGYVTLQLLQLGHLPVRWNTYLQYLDALSTPAAQPHVLQIQLGGVIGITCTLGVTATAVALIVKAREQPLYGSARFASVAEVRASGLFSTSADGIVLGRMRDQLLRLSGQQFVILAAPTRSGKGVGIVVPNLLDYQHSVVVLDIKQENFDLTSGWRQQQGQAVYLFNPFAENRRGHRWNPMSYVSADHALRITDLQGIAAMLYPEVGGDNGFWVGLARNAFVGLALYVLEDHADAKRSGESLPAPSIGGIYRLASSGKGSMKDYIEVLASQPFLSLEASNALSSLAANEEKTFSSIFSTLMEPLNAWISPILDAATSADDFNFADLRRRPTTIYIGIQPNKLSQAKLIINLFFSQLINENTRELPQQNPELRYQCLLLMDEFTAMGKVGIVSDAVSYMAGYNLRLLPIIQSLSQLHAVYGKEVARTIVTNHAMQIVYAPREQQDANEYSEMLGYRTVRKNSRSKGRETSISESDEKRPLMLPQELKDLGFDREILFYERLSGPVLCDKIRYYEDPYFMPRLLPPADVPLLPV